MESFQSSVMPSRKTRLLGSMNTFTSSNGLLSYTLIPYIPDAGSSCGQNFVNSGSAGTLDGVTIVEGHEYAETVTDQFPNGGWLDSGGSEIGDKCAWISSGQGVAPVPLGAWVGAALGGLVSFGWVRWSGTRGLGTRPPA